jgi:hypothetical protein
MSGLHGSRRRLKLVFLLGTVILATSLLRKKKLSLKRFGRSIVSTVQDVVQNIDEALEKISRRSLVSANEASDMLLDLRQMVQEMERGYEREED